MYGDTDITDILTLERELKLKKLPTSVSKATDKLRCVSNLSVKCHT